MCDNRYISICLIEKNLANKMVKTIVVNPIGSNEIGPILYQLFTPRISETKKNKPSKNKTQTK